MLLMQACGRCHQDHPGLGRFCTACSARYQQRQDTLVCAYCGRPLKLRRDSPSTTTHAACLAKAAAAPRPLCRLCQLPFSPGRARPDATAHALCEERDARTRGEYIYPRYNQDLSPLQETCLARQGCCWATADNTACSYAMDLSSGPCRVRESNAVRLAPTWRHARRLAELWDEIDTLTRHLDALAEQMQSVEDWDQLSDDFWAKHRSTQSRVAALHVLRRDILETGDG